MPADRTRDELVTETLRVLKVLAAGQSPSAEDHETVESKVDGVLAELSSRRVIYIADGDAIPSAAFLSLAEVLAGRCTTEFGLTGTELAEVERKSAMGEARLSEMSAGRTTGETQQAEYF